MKTTANDAALLAPTLKSFGLTYVAFLLLPANEQEGIRDLAKSFAAIGKRGAARGRNVLANAGH